MFRHKVEDDFPELPPMLDETAQPEPGLAARKRGCILALVGATLALVCALAGIPLYGRYQASLPTANPTFPPDDGLLARVESGLQVFSFGPGGNLREGNINDLPVTLPTRLDEASLSALDALAYPEGVFFYPDAGQWVVFGPPAASGAHPSSDDFLVALHAVYSGQPLAVSIDPTGDPVTQAVRYEGPTAQTHFGWVMFEADRRMKTLSMGQDNLTGAVARAGVPGYTNLLDLELSLGQESRGEARRRFWFTAPLVEVEQTDDGYGMMITALDLAVQTEYLDENWQTLAAQPPDPAGQAFAAHLDQNLALYAQEYPVFDDLQAIARWTALAHWLRQADLPIEPALWLAQTPQPYPQAPDTTPAITVSHQEARGNIMYTLSLWGGVDLGMKPVIRRASQATRQALERVSWQFAEALGLGRVEVSEPGLALAALAPLGLERGPVAMVDLPLLPPISLEYRQAGWQVQVPSLERVGQGQDAYFLFSSPPTSSPVILSFSGQDAQTGARVFTNREAGLWLAEYADRFVLTRGEFAADGQFSYQSGCQAHFNPQGQPLKDALDGSETEYVYQNGKLAGLERDGLQVTFEYGGAQVRGVRSSAGGQVMLEYRDGLLTGLRSGAGDFRAFDYDEQGRLARESDASGQALRETVYDDLGRVVFQWREGSGTLYDWLENGGLRLYDGAALSAWRGAAGKDLDEMKTVLRLAQHPAVKHRVFARRVGDDVVILADERSFRLPAALLRNPVAFRRKLAGLLEFEPGDAVLVSDAGLEGVSLEALFAGALPLSIETLDEKRARANLDRLLEPTGFTPENAAILNGLPASAQELGMLGFETGEFLLWDGWLEKLDTLARQAGFAPSALRARQLTDALGQKRSVLVVVAHGDQGLIYQPDGAVFDVNRLTEAERQAIDQNHPLVILLSCKTGDVLPGQASLAQRLLDFGAQMVIAPNGNLPLKDAGDILATFLTNAKNSDPVRAILNAILKKYPDWLVPSDDWRDRFFRFRVEKLLPNMEAVI